MPAEAPPTYDQLEKLQRECDDGLLDDLSQALAMASVDLAKSTGLLSGDASSRWDIPSIEAVISGDGSVIEPTSEATVDEYGEVKGSRAKENPRFGPYYKGKKGNETLAGIPITLVCVHGRKY